jgi:two-component system, cell cycle response regulator
MVARILVVEDNPDNLNLMKYLLRAFGHTVLTACDGNEGLESARRELPDLILCDLQMPNIDGFELIRVLRLDPRLANRPVIAVTAYAMRGDDDKVLAAGFDGYISKPIVPEEFVGQVERFLQPSDLPVAKRATILVVDNSPVNLNLMHSTLEPFGFRVISATSAMEGLDLARLNAPDLILSDLHMPEVDGYDFLKAVKLDPALRAIPFAMVSSTMWHDVDPEVAHSLGATKLILRPIEPQKLIAEIEECLTERSPASKDATRTMSDRKTIAMAHILLIEDDRDTLELMAGLLRAAGHKPLSVGSGESALGILHQYDSVPDLIICDLCLPWMDGFDVAGALKKDPRLAHVPLVAVCATSAERNKIFAAGFSGFVPRPIVPETFAAAMSAFLELELGGATPSHPAPAGATSSGQYPAEKNGCTILAVDDRPMNLELTRSMLEPFGYEVVTATGVHEALTRAREISPDLILTDVHMGDGSGFDLVKAMQADPALREIAWIAISATYLEMDPRAMDLGLNDANFVLRPIEPKALIAKIEACIADRAPKAGTLNENGGK